MRLTAKQKFAVLAAVAAALAVDNLRLRVTCRALEKVVNYAVGGIHLDGAGGIYDPEDDVPGEAYDKFDGSGADGPGSESG